MGGLTEEELALLENALIQSIHMQIQFFPGRRPILSFSSGIAMICLFRKLLALKTDFKSVLEIGPGNGFLSFILSQHSSLQCYHQIEACQSLYLYQSAINNHAFKSNFLEHAYPSRQEEFEFTNRAIHPP